MQTQPPVRATPDNAIVWHEEQLYLLDQRYLPERTEFLPLNGVAETARAIRDMVVRGAPAIGVTAAYGVVLAARDRYAALGPEWRSAITEDLDLLAASRPTAVNLSWALRRMHRLIDQIDGGDPVPELAEEAEAIHDEDRSANLRLGGMGADLFLRTTSVLTHCNAGALATGGYGTALGVIRSAFRAGKIERVYADETRPWMQGTRLTAWELKHSGIPVVVQADGAAASLLAEGRVGWVIVGADRIAANGDVANKIGTYGLAVLARHHRVKFMVAAPTSTIDLSTKTGAEIPIEERDPDEVLSCGGKRLGMAGLEARNPVFDVTPADLVDVIVTERGIAQEPTAEKIRALMEDEAAPELIRMGSRPPRR